MSRHKANKLVFDRFSGWINSVCPKSDRSSVAEFASKVGATPQMVRHWRDGKYLPNTAQLYEIKKHFDISIDWLLTGIRAAGTCTMPPGSDEFCSMLRDILGQNTDEQVKSALRTNLVAFKNSVEKDRDALEKNRKITDLEKKVDYLMQSRLYTLETQPHRRY